MTILVFWVIWVCLDLCLKSLSFACLTWISLRCTGVTSSSTGTNVNTVSTSSTISPCFSHLLSAYVTAFLDPIVDLFSGPFPFRNYLHLITLWEVFSSDSWTRFLCIYVDFKYFIEVRAFEDGILGHYFLESSKAFWWTSVHFNFFYQLLLNLLVKSRCGSSSSTYLFRIGLYSRNSLVVSGYLGL